MFPQATTVILNTSRLTLRTWRETDLQAMATINANSRVMEYFPSIQDFASTEKMVQHICFQYEEYGYTLYAVELKNTGQFIGFVGLDRFKIELPHFHPAGLPIVEIGWRLSFEHWNQGYATESAQAVLNYAFRVLHLPELISITAVINQRSQRIMEKIGLHRHPSDDFDHPRIADNHPLKKHVLYRLTQSEYLKAHSD